MNLFGELAVSPNKRMQSDQPIRYANGLAADARRYIVGLAHRYH
jgi:hypothetical protein